MGESPDQFCLSVKDMSSSQGMSGASGDWIQNEADCNETALLSQLVLLLGKQPEHTLLLSNLGALLPNDLRSTAMKLGGLRSWLLKFPKLFQVSGRCGRESVMMTLGARGALLDKHQPTEVTQASGKEKVLEVNADVEHTRPPKARIDISHVTVERVRQEVEEHLCATGRNQVLLSMLGVALSQEARTFAKKIYLGLKNCLAEYPQIFRMEGMPGSETVWYLPGLEAEAEGRKISGVETMANDDADDAQSTEASMGQQSECSASSWIHPDAGDDQPSSPQLEPVDGALLGVPGDVLESDLHLGVAELIANSTTSSLVFGNTEDSTYDEHGSQAGKYSGESAPASPDFRETSMGMADGFGTPSNWGTPNVIANDSMPMTSSWGALDRADPQSRSACPLPVVPSFPTWNCPVVPLVPAFAIWQGLPLPQGPPGTWSSCSDHATMRAFQDEHRVLEDIAAAAVAVTAAARTTDTSNSKSPPTDAQEDYAVNAFKGKARPATERSDAHLYPPNHPFTKLADGNIDGPEQSLGTNTPVVRLRGLPFTTTEQDVLAFFSVHDVTDGIADGVGVVKMLFKADGQCSGQAVVQMKSRRESNKAQEALHGQWMRNRYIEAFSYGCDEDECSFEVSNTPSCQQQENAKSQEPEIASPQAHSEPAPGEYIQLLQRRLALTSISRPPGDVSSAGRARSCPPVNRSATLGQLHELHDEHFAIIQDIESCSKL